MTFGAPPGKINLRWVDCDHLSMMALEGGGKDLPVEKEKLMLESTKSTQISLESIRNGDAGLNAHRQKMLGRVPETGDWARFRLNTIELIDLAYLTAMTGHEFALLRGKREDVLFHGAPAECNFIGALEEMLKSRQLELLGHSHPGEPDPEPSPADREVIRKIGQARSTVISGMTGRTKEFTSDPFEI